MILYKCNVTGKGETHMDKIKKIITNLFVTALTYFFIYYLLNFPS